MHVLRRVRCLVALLAQRSYEDETSDLRALQLAGRDRLWHFVP